MLPDKREMRFGAGLEVPYAAGRSGPTVQERKREREREREKEKEREMESIV